MLYIILHLILQYMYMYMQHLNISVELNVNDRKIGTDYLQTIQWNTLGSQIVTRSSEPIWYQDGSNLVTSLRLYRYCFHYLLQKCVQNKVGIVEHEASVFLCMELMSEVLKRNSHPVLPHGWRKLQVRSRKCIFGDPFFSVY